MSKFTAQLLMQAGEALGSGLEKIGGAIGANNQAKQMAQQQAEAQRKAKVQKSITALFLSSWGAPLAPETIVENGVERPTTQEEKDVFNEKTIASVEAGRIKDLSKLKTDTDKNRIQHQNNIQQKAQTTKDPVKVTNPVNHVKNANDFLNKLKGGQ